jgi:hypothetical protein
MDLSPREMIDLADACGVDVEFSNVNVREYLEAVSPKIGGPFAIRKTPRSARAYLCALLGCPVDTEWETVCAAAQRASGQGAAVAVHPGRDELTEVWEGGDIARLGYGLLCCPMCAPPGLLRTNVAILGGQGVCDNPDCQHTDNTGRASSMIWLNPDRKEWAQTAPCEE